MRDTRAQVRLEVARTHARYAVDVYLRHFEDCRSAAVGRLCPECERRSVDLMAARRHVERMEGLDPPARAARGGGL